MKGHTITVSDDVYDYLKGMIEDEHAQNTDMSEEYNALGEPTAHRPTFSEVIGYLIEDREASYEPNRIDVPYPIRCTVLNGAGCIQDYRESFR